MITGAGKEAEPQFKAEAAHSAQVHNMWIDGKDHFVADRNAEEARHVRAEAPAPPGNALRQGCAEPISPQSAQLSPPEPIVSRRSQVMGEESQTIVGMLRDLGRQLAALRQEAGLTQQGLAVLVGYSRPAVSLAEIGRQAVTRRFWRACDKVLDTGGVLAAGADQISAVRDAESRAAALAAQTAREARALAGLAAAEQAGDGSATVTTLQPCPACGTQVIVVTTLLLDDAQTRTDHGRAADETVRGAQP